MATQLGTSGLQQQAPSQQGLHLTVTLVSAATWPALAAGCTGPGASVG